MPGSGKYRRDRPAVSFGSRTRRARCVAQGEVATAQARRCQARTVRASRRLRRALGRQIDAMAQRKRRLECSLTLGKLRRQQRGAALLVMLTVVVLGVAWFGVSQLAASANFA